MMIAQLSAGAYVHTAWLLRDAGVCFAIALLTSNDDRWTFEIQSRARSEMHKTSPPGADPCVDLLRTTVETFALLNAVEVEEYRIDGDVTGLARVLGAYIYVDQKAAPANQAN